MLQRAQGLPSLSRIELLAATILLLAAATAAHAGALADTGTHALAASRHDGWPIVRLWESGQSLVAIGLNPHGVPGIYFTQKVPD